jgi:hypothetical protein
MKKPKRKGSRLTNKSSDQEIIRWTESRDIFDRLEKGVSEVVEDHSDLDEALREAIFQDNTAQLNMRLPPAMKAVLSKLARQRTTDATTLARIWLAERLEQELKAGWVSASTSVHLPPKKTFLNVKPAPWGRAEKAHRHPFGCESAIVVTRDRREKGKPYQSLVNEILAEEMRKAS